MQDHRTTAQRWADQVTEFSGSWAFIGWFTVVCGFWIVANGTGTLQWDPYPFLFLNWLLTVVSTFQNPLILLSQNRQNEVDREHMQQLLAGIAELKAEIRQLRADPVDQSVRLKEAAK